MTVVVLSGDGALETLRPEWRRLEATGEGPFFAGLDWAEAAVEALGARPHLVGVRQGGDLVALWPLERRGLFLRPLGAALADVTGPLVRPGHEADALASLADAVPRGSVLDLPELPADGPWARGVGRGWRRAEVPTSVRLTLRLEGGGDAFLASLRPSTRKKLLYEWRRLEREGWRLERVGRADVPAAMAELFRLHTARWRRRGLPGSFFSPARRRFHRKLASRLAAGDRLGLFALERDGVRIALLYGFVWQGAFLYYAGGFEPAWRRWSPGMGLLFAVLRWSADAGLTRFEFLRGEEAYKARFPCLREGNVRLLAAPGGWPGGLLVPAWAGLAAAMARAKRRIERAYGG